MVSHRKYKLTLCYIWKKFRCRVGEHNPQNPGDVTLTEEWLEAERDHSFWNR